MKTQNGRPRLKYDPETGFLYLAAYNRTQRVCRVGDDGRIYIWWRRACAGLIPGEHGYSVDEIVDAIAETE